LTRKLGFFLPSHGQFGLPRAGEEGSTILSVARGRNRDKIVILKQNWDMKE
jgi:hypothetical protein